MMHSWLEYLAFLSWQNQSLSLKDFKTVQENLPAIKSLEDLKFYISNKETYHYLYIQKNWWKQAEQDKRECQKLGIQTAWPFSSDYPTSLNNNEQAPALISWRGEACWKDNFLLSIVGSRKASQDTLLWMDLHLSHFLKSKKVCVMSGGARGVDQKAHALCLSAKHPTLCFLPCGLKNYYPAVLTDWEKPVLNSGGAFISVFPLNAPMRKSHFHIRNKVLAGMSDLVFVMQAEVRSGTMVTAGYALNAGRTICTLPASPLYPLYKGNLSLINDGAFMIRDSLDLEILYSSLLSL